MSHLVFLRSFYSVYRHGSVSRAADELALSQPAVSQHLRQLEARLGEQLFERHGRGIQPTPAAHELHRSVGTHLEALDSALAPRRDAKRRLAGTVLLGVTSGWAAHLLPRLLRALPQGLRVSLHSASPPALLDMLAGDQLQLVVTPASIPHAAVVYETVITEPLVLVHAPSGAPASTQDMPPALPLIDQQGPLSTLEAYWTQCYGEAPPPASLVVPDQALALAAARSGAGLAVLPASLCAEALQAGELRAIESAKPVPRSTLFLARARGAELPLRVAFLRELILDAG